MIVSCKSHVSEHQSNLNDSPSGEKELLNSVMPFAEEVLGEDLRMHYTEYKRGNLGVDAFFESEDLIGYTTFSNELYQKVSSPTDLMDCILFAAEFNSQESAEWAFNHIKSNSVISVSEVEGMVGIMPVQVRFMDLIRGGGDGGLFTHLGNYVFFLPENGEAPPILSNWPDYENFFLQSIQDDNESLETVRLRE